jgi:hypothetical protein
MKAKTAQLVAALSVISLLAGTVLAAPQVTRKRVERQRVHRPSRHPSPYGRREQKGMRHYVAQQGSSYTVVNGCVVPVPAQVIYTTPTPVFVGPTILTTTYAQPGQIYTPAYWNYYAPPPPNPRPAIVYTPCIRPGLNINLSF